MLTPFRWRLVAWVVVPVAFAFFALGAYDYAVSDSTGFFSSIGFWWGSMLISIGIGWTILTRLGRETRWWVVAIYIVFEFGILFGTQGIVACNHGNCF